MAIDRIEKSRHSFKKKRRIILYLDSKPGQISSALLLELLKLEDGESFSKHKFVQKVDDQVTVRQMSEEDHESQHQKSNTKV